MDSYSAREQGDWSAVGFLEENSQVTLLSRQKSIERGEKHIFGWH